MSFLEPVVPPTAPAVPLSNLHGSLVMSSVLLAPNAHNVMLDMYDFGAQGRYMILLGISKFPAHYLKFDAILDDEFEAKRRFVEIYEYLRDDVKGWSDLSPATMIEQVQKRGIPLKEVV